MKLNYEEFKRYENFWKRSNILTEKQKKEIILLANKFMERVKENGDEVDDVLLLYPEDSSDFTAFRDFAYAMDAKIVPRKGGGAKITNWFLQYKVQVE